MPAKCVTCKSCGRRVAVNSGGDLRAHNDGTHGPGQAFRRCIRSNASPTADEYPNPTTEESGHAE